MEVRGMGNKKYTIAELIAILREYPQNATLEIDVETDIGGYSSFSTLDSILWEIKENTVTLLISDD